MYQFAGLVVALGLGLALAQAIRRARLPGAHWADVVVAWYLAFALLWTVLALGVVTYRG